MPSADTFNGMWPALPINASECINKPPTYSTAANIKMITKGSAKALPCW